MNKEEIRHFKSMLRQGSLRHMNIILDDKFQKELLNIIKDYEDLQQENKQLKDNWNLLKGYLEHSIDWENQLNEQEDTYKEIYREVLDKIKELKEGVK